MQNKHFLYRVIPQKSYKHNKIPAAKKSNDSYELGMKPVNFFENCYIFSEPSTSSKSQTKQKKQKVKPTLSKSSKKVKNNFPNLSLKPQFETLNPQDLKYHKISLQLKPCSSNLYAIHSRRKPNSLNGFFNEKQTETIQQYDQRLEINAFNSERLAKRASFVKRGIQTERNQRKSMSKSKIEKILSLYPPQISVKKQLFYNRKGSNLQLNQQNKGKKYRPWSPDKLFEPPIMEITEDLQDFLLSSR